MLGGTPKKEVFDTAIVSHVKGRFVLTGLTRREQGAAEACGAEAASGGRWLLPSPFCPEGLARLVEALPGLTVDGSAAGAMEQEVQKRRFFAEYSNTATAPTVALRREDARLDPHQGVGASFLLSAGRALLCDDPGLGKTAQAICAADAAPLPSGTTKLVIAPKSLLLQWQTEIGRFSAHPECAVLGMKDVLPGGVPWLVTNYEVAVRRQEELAASSPGVLIVDEAARIKNRKAARTRGIWRIAKSSAYCFLLTATPIRNYPEELWSLLHCLEPNRYRGFWQFANTFIEQSDNGFGIDLGGVRADRLEELHGELIPRLLQRSKALLNLPPLTFEEVVLQPEAKAAKAYRQMEKTFVALLESGEVLLAPNTLARLTRLRQITADPALCEAPGGSAKTQWLLDWLEDNAATRKVVVFSPFKTYIRRLAQATAQYGPVVITGDETLAEREAAKRRLNTDPTCRLLLGTDSAAGEGLNLQEQADVVVFTGKSWTPDLVEQCVGRVYRRGQSRPVHVYSLVCADTVDRDIEEVLADKAASAREALSIQAVAERLRKRVNTVAEEVAVVG